MSTSSTAQNGPSEPQRATASSLSHQISQNIESVVALQRRELEQTTPSQRQLERISRFVGRPLFLVGLLSFALAWVGINVGLKTFSVKPFDPYPFSLLQGILTLLALITTTIVLIAQNRQTKLEQQHSHLDLQVNLLTEQKVTKLIHLIEELRHDLPMVKDRHDHQAAIMQEGADTSQVLSAIEEQGLTNNTVTASAKVGSET